MNAMKMLMDCFLGQGICEPYERFQYDPVFIKYHCDRCGGYAPTNRQFCIDCLISDWRKSDG